MGQIHDTIDDLLRIIADTEACYAGDITWYSWPEAFPSTSGPHGGIGGQAITIFQVFAFRTPDGKTTKCCDGIWKSWNGMMQEPWNERKTRK